MPSPKRDRAGRPSKLTDAVERTICEAIADGNYYATACAAAGIDHSTFRRWLTSKASRFCGFREAVRRAEAKAEVRIVQQWQAACPSDWRACRDFLARRFPDRWGPKAVLAGDPHAPLTVNHEHTVDIQAELEPILGALIDSLVQGGPGALPSIRGVAAKPYQPHRPHPKQALFLCHDHVREVLYGGAAGGGKTDALLMAALAYVHVPGYAALLLMRTYKDLTLPKAGASRAREWLAGTGAHWDSQTTTWRFPSGASLTFGYLADKGAEERYRTAEFQFIAFDELTRFDEGPYLYLFSRLRRLAGSAVPVRMRSATNPGGRGHEWVRARFIPEAYSRLRDEDLTQAQGRAWWTAGRAFIPARLEDNPSLDAADYELSLAHLPGLLRARMREGDWSAHEWGHFRPEWFSTYRDMGDAWQVEGTGEIVLKGSSALFISVDPAGGVSEQANPTAIGAAVLTPGRSLLVLEVKRGRYPVERVVAEVADLCRRRRPLWVVMEDEFLQSAYIRQARAHPDIPTVMALKSGGQSKLVRATPAILLAEQGRICLPHPGPAVPWLGAFVAELCAFTGDDALDASDDQVDMLSQLVRALDRFGGHVRGGEPFSSAGQGGRDE